MPYNSRLKIVKDKDIKYFNLIDISSSVSVDTIKNDYKVIDGNRNEGILQGIGLVSAGRKLSYAIPIYEINNTDKNSLYKNIAEYTSLLMNSYSYSFYIEHYINNFWYSARVNIIETSGYTLKLTNHIEGFSFKCQMIDNFFTGDTIEEDIGFKGIGIKDIEYFSKSLVPSNISFEWEITGKAGNLNAHLIHSRNYGMRIQTNLPSGTHKLKYKNDTLTLYDENSNNYNGILIEYSGVQPFLDIGRNILNIKSNYNTISFIIKYSKGIAL